MIERVIGDRMKIYRKGDDKDRLEFGAIEAGRKCEGKNGTKYVTDYVKC